MLFVSCLWPDWYYFTNPTALSNDSLASMTIQLIIWAAGNMSWTSPADWPVKGTNSGSLPRLMPAISISRSCSACCSTSFLDRPFHCSIKSVRSALGEASSYVSLPAIGNTMLINSALIASSQAADNTLFFKSRLTAVSVEARNRVPMLIPWAPKSNAAASPRSSAIPPAAITGIRFPPRLLRVTQVIMSFFYHKNPQLQFPALLRLLPQGQRCELGILFFIILYIYRT